jgi:hypothetical protein
VSEIRTGTATFNPYLDRRQFLTVVGGIAAGILVPMDRLISPEPARASLTGMAPQRVAMHVHGSWSEGLASWQAQFGQAAANAVDVLYLTDHDWRATAYRYLTSLSGVTWVRSSTGTLRQQASTTSGGGFRLLAESGSTTAAASVMLALQGKPLAFNRLRTSIAGHSLRHSVSSRALTGGSTYEVIVSLSYHPATGGRPAGNYELRYRFGAPGSGRFTENNGLRGIVTMPTQAAGTTVTLRPELDVGALWPDMIALDNSFYGLAFSARSPARGSVADITVSSVQIVRSQSDPASVASNQQQLISTYSAAFPTVTARATTEVSRHLPDMNPFGVPQFFSDYALDASTNHDAFYEEFVHDVNTRGGLVSWNHPFGYNTGPLLSSAERTAKRRDVYRQLSAVDVYGADVLEVGYTLRGNVDTSTHLDLWDTFSRNGRFLTGNGTSDDHGGKSWKGLGNGFLTATWASSKADPDVVAALRSGRAFLYHCGRWPNAELDMVVDSIVPMGRASVSSLGSRRLTVYVRNLPTGGRVELVRGPVDWSGAVDPSVSVVRELTASSFVDGEATTTVDTTTSSFFRATVRRSDGAIVGAGNPVWLLRSAPSGGIPSSRAA